MARENEPGFLQVRERVQELSFQVLGLQGEQEKDRPLCALVLEESLLGGVVAVRVPAGPMTEGLEKRFLLGLPGGRRFKSVHRQLFLWNLFFYGSCFGWNHGI